MTEILEQTIDKDAADDLQGQHLTFHISDSVYSVELQYVVEIIQVQPRALYTQLHKGDYQPPGEHCAGDRRPAEDVHGGAAL